MTRKLDPQLVRLLEDAAILQKKVPDTVLVGGSVAAFYAGHRLSFDHDHVLSNLQERFDTVLQALEADPEYIVNRVVPGKIILGEHAGIEYGIRQLIRQRPLEVVEEHLPSGETIRVPTPEEALRIKAYLLAKRNQTRDFLDVVALSEAVGVERAAEVLSGMDDYYRDPDQPVSAVSTQIAGMLANPEPRDRSVTRTLPQYKSLDKRWHNWDAVRDRAATIGAKIR